ncbi:transposase family protein, partial [Lentzea indica]|uniref:transposase family protein n=1 Tax=Lentzea indica TaxID=2604800 RepID=UPI0035E4169A
MPAVSSCPIPAVLDRLAPVAAAVDRVADLREFVAGVPDPRRRRGVRHSLASILLVAASAVAAGARSFTAIGEWAADAPSRYSRCSGSVRSPSTWHGAHHHRDADRRAVRREFAALPAGAGT